MKNTTFIILASAILIALVALSTTSMQVQAYNSATAIGISSEMPVSASNPATPIKHIIIMINENHAFDNFFGVFPGLPSRYSLNLSTCMHYTTTQKTAMPCEKPFNADSMLQVQGTDQCHTSQCMVPAYNGGKMNGFYQEDGNRTMAYYNGNAIPDLWDYASYYTLDYNFFASTLSYSLSNHLYAVSAAAPKDLIDASYTCDSDASGSNGNACWDLTYPEIGTAMTNAGVTWGYFQYNWNDAIDCTGNYNDGTKFSTAGSGGLDGLWAGEAEFRAVQNTATECNSLGNIKDFENDLKSGNLPQVSWVIPEPSSSAHPGQGTLESHQLYLTSVINMVEASSAWSSSVIFVTYDESGGYYDNVVPKQLDEFGSGFRVPLIAISPYSIPGGLIGGCTGTKTVACAPEYKYYDNYTNVHGTTNQEDFSAFLSTIEYNWGIKPIATRDAEEPNLFYLLNFSQAPLKPLYFSSNYDLAKYPVSSCVASGGCKIGTPYEPLGQMNVYNAPTPSWAESTAQALAYSGNGDADD